MSYCGVDLEEPGVSNFTFVDDTEFMFTICPECDNKFLIIREEKKYSTAKKEHHEGAGFYTFGNPEEKVK